MSRYSTYEIMGFLATCRHGAIDVDEPWLEEKTAGWRGELDEWEKLMGSWHGT
jgi:hypothetical protein